jgi:ankyrin repeat protein
MMLLFLDENVKIKVDSSELPAQNARLGGKALQLAAEKGKEGKFAPLVTLLLDNGAPYVLNDKGQWPIHSAVESENVEMVQRLLTNTTKRADPDAQNADMQRAIHLAAENNWVEIAKRIVESMEKESLNTQDKNGKTALIVAAEKGRSEIARLLLDEGVRTNLPDYTGHIALHYAALNGHRECVWALLKHAETECRKEATGPESAHSVVPDDGIKLTGCSNEEPDGDTDDQPHVGGGGGGGESGAGQMHLKVVEKANLDVINAQKKTALHLASQKGKSEVVKILLNYGANPSLQDSQNQTALILAAKHGKADTVASLLQWQAQNWGQVELDSALLSAAVKLSAEGKDKGSPEEVIDKLIDGGAKSGRQDPSDGMTALHWALKVKDERIAEKLIATMKQKDEDLENKENKKQQSALLMAVDSGRDNAVMAILKKGADTKSKDSRKRTALHWAAVRRNVNVVRELLKENDKSIVDEVDAQGRTALHLAAHSGEAKLTELLLEAKADPYARDNDGQSALMLAAELRRVEAVMTLLSKRNDPTARDNSGKSALDWAATKGFNDIVVELLKSPRMEDDKANNQALGLAAKEGHLLVSITLYDKIKDSKLRELAVPTILFSAAAASSISASVIERLMKMVIDPNYRDKDDRTALMLAVLNNKWLLFNKLLDVEADPDLQDHEKRTVLMMAAERDNWVSVEALLRVNANPNIQDEQGYTALHYAAERGHSRTMQMLFGSARQATNANVQDSRKRTALHIALEKLSPRQRSSWYHTRTRRDRSSNIWHYLLQSGARPDIQDEEGQTPLHWAILQNRSDIARGLLEASSSDNSVNLDIPDAEGRTPLHVATERAHSDIVYTLLEDYSFKPDSRDRNGRTPLLLAAEGGDGESVRMLLEKNANPNLADRKSRTPLLQAARNGHWFVVCHLIRDQKREEANLHGRDRREKANLDARDNMGRTALMLAAENGHDRIVTDLQNNGANSGLIDYEGKKAWQRAMDKGHADVVGSLLSQLDAPTQDMTPVNEALLLASRRGWIELVKVLLKHEADVTFRSDEGWTALHMAAMGGHHEVVKTLLEKGVGVVIKDKKNRTALMQATEHGFESIFELLLVRSEVKNDIGGWMGPEALRCASEKGNRGIVSRLLTSNVNCNGEDSAGRTAMALAAANGNQEIVEFLLLQGADPNLKDNQSRGALHHAAWGGHDDMVKSLLDYDTEVNALDNCEQAALHLAAERASTSVVRLLLAKGANANAKSRDGQTALHRAAWGGSRDVVKLLCKSGADPFARDSFNNKPWQVAAEKGHESIVETLLEEEESIKDELISQKKGLIFASQKGYTAIANALLNKGAEPTVTDQEGLTPLHWAAKRGDHAMVELLIRKEGPIKILDIQDNHQRTPLCLAVLEGRATVVRILLEKGADPNIPGEKGRTVLHIAAAEGNGEILQILDNHNADPHARDDQRQKAWLLAAEAGYHQIVRLLFRREVDLNPQSQKIEELFLQMAARGFVLMVQLLLENGVNKDATDRLGRVAIGLAAEEEKDDVVELLLKAGANPGVPDSSRQTPLLWAAKSGNLRIMKLLLDNITSKSSDQVTPRTGGSAHNIVPNSDVQTLTTSDMLNHTDPQGRTALLIAIQNKNNDAVELLIREGLAHGIDLDLKDTMGRTALHLVAETGNDNLVGLLLEKKASQTLQDTLGRTALFLAAEHGQNTAVETLLRSSHAAVEIADLHQRTALQVAAEQGNSSMTKTLLECTAKRDHQDGLGRTALLLAAENGEKKVVDLLLEDDARQELADRNGRTPLLLAVANGDKAIVKSLLDHRMADVTATDKNGRSLLHLAVQSGNKDVAWLIAEQMTRLSGARSRDEDSARGPNSIPDHN